MAEAATMQTIPARHGTATFVPKGSTIKIVNTSGTQVIDTWAFALPTAPKGLLDKGSEEKESEDKKEDEGRKEESKKTDESKKDDAAPAAPPATPQPAAKSKGKKGKNDLDLPSQEDAEAATAQGSQQPAEDGGASKGADGSTPKKGWTAYLPSLRGSGGQKAVADGGAADEKKKKDAAADDKEQKQQQKESSRTWGSYLPSGQGYTSYLPSKGAISAFAGSHYRDPNKSYAEQLADFSKTPVGAAGISALSGSGAASSLYAGYSAWSSTNPDQPPMEFLSMPHTRASTTHLVPRVNDVLVSNIRQPMLTLTEDTCGVHDTLIAACDPVRYQQLGVEKWEEHGSCAENLVLALKELNERAGLKGNKAIGADVTIHTVPAPLNLFMNIPWSDKGDVKFDAPKAKEGDYVRFRAERDVVVIMSACPQDVLDINTKDPKDGHFVVETPESDTDDEEDVRTKLEKTAAPAQKAEKKKPRKLGGTGTSTPTAKTPEEKKPDEKLEDKKVGGGEKKAEEKKAVPEKKPEEKKTESKKPEEKKPEEKAAPAPAPAATKPKAAPKKLTDPNSGEKRKPKKLEKRGSMAPTASSQTASQKSGS